MKDRKRASLAQYPSQKHSQTVKNLFHTNKFRRIFAASCAGAAAMLLGLSIGIPRALADNQQPVEVDTKARSLDIITHLNAVLRFYRASSVPVQKVGEPNDIVYRDQTVSMAMQAANLAFQSAKAEATLLADYDKHHGNASAVAEGSEVERLQEAKTRVTGQQATLKASIEALNQQLNSGRVKNVAALQAQLKGEQESLDLANAMQDAIEKIMATSGTAGQSKLTSDITNLQRSVPELSSQAKPVAAQLTTIDASQSAGVSSQT
ncbi:MAG: mechanosensitive ion channel protein MscS, partial [Silvibacterium sp.]